MDSKELFGRLKVQTDCPVCYCSFESKAEHKGEENHVPRVLRCGHTLCHQCVENNLPLEKRKFQCPFCRMEQPTPPNRAEGIPVNYTVVDFLQTMHGVEKKPFCHLHTEPFTSFCTPCQVLVCPHCLSEEGDHVGCTHRIISSAANQLRESLSANASSLESMRARLQSEAVGYQDVKEQAQRMIDDLKSLTELCERKCGDVAQLIQNAQGVRMEAVRMRDLDLTSMLFVSNDFKARLEALRDDSNVVLEQEHKMIASLPPALNALGSAFNAIRPVLGQLVQSEGGRKRGRGDSELQPVHESKVKSQRRSFSDINDEFDDEDEELKSAAADIEDEQDEHQDEDPLWELSQVVDLNVEVCHMSTCLDANSIQVMDSRGNEHVVVEVTPHELRAQDHTAPEMDSIYVQFVGDHLVHRYGTGLRFFDRDGQSYGASPRRFSPVACLLLQNNRLAVAYMGDRIEVLERQGPIWGGSARITLKQTRGKALALLQLGDGSLVTASKDIIIWRADSNEVIRVLKGHRKPAISLVQLASNRLASLSHDQTIRIWNFHSEREPITIQLAHLPTCMVLWGNVLVSASYSRSRSRNDSFVEAWDVNTGELAFRLPTALDVSSMLVLPDGRLVIGGANIAEDKHQLQVWRRR